MLSRASTREVLDVSTELAKQAHLHRLLPVRLLNSWLVCILRYAEKVVILAVPDRNNAGQGEK